MAAVTVESTAAGLAAVLPYLGHRTSFDGWQAIDDVERRTAGPHRCRRKITDLDEMVTIAHGRPSVNNDL